MREIRPSGSEGGARFKPLSLPLSAASKISETYAKEFLRTNVVILVSSEQEAVDAAGIEETGCALQAPGFSKGCNGKP